MGFTSTLRGAGEASQSVGDAIFKHADSIQHLAETLEEEVSRYTDELAAQIALFHESAGRITSAGLEIARAGDRIALCGEHLALGMQQLVIVVAASMLTLVTGLFGWRYFVLGSLCLWLCGFEITRRLSSPPPGSCTQEPQQDQRQQSASSSPNGGAPLHSALHHAAPNGSSPKRVSFEHGSQTTDSGLPKPRSGYAGSLRIADITGRQGLDGVYISSDVAQRPSTAPDTGNGTHASSNDNAALPASAAAAGGNGTGASGGAGSPNSATDGSMPATLQAAQDLAGRIRERSVQFG